MRRPYCRMAADAPTNVRSTTRVTLLPMRAALTTRCALPRRCRCTRRSRCSASRRCSASGSRCRRRRSCSAARSIAAATLAIVCVVRGQPVGRPAMPVAVNGAILALHWVTFFAAVQVGAVAVALLGYASFPLFVLMLERRLFTRRAIARRIGRRPCWPRRASSRSSRISPGRATRARTCARARVGVHVRAACRCATAGSSSRMTPTRIALWQNLFAAACLAPIVALVDALSAWPTASDIALLLVLGVACTALRIRCSLRACSACRRTRRASSPRSSPSTASRSPPGCSTKSRALRTLAGGTLIVGAALAASRRSV